MHFCEPDKRKSMHQPTGLLQNGRNLSHLALLPANLRPATPGHDEVVGQILALLLLHEPGEDGGGPLVIRERFAELAHVAQGDAAVAQADARSMARFL